MLPVIRIIPAWAGMLLVITSVPDHPRVGGEHIQLPRHHGRSITGSRIIPAWAGNTSSMRFQTYPIRSDHPRVGGEHGHDSGTVTPADTDHPRVGGEHSSKLLTSGIAGSSPRGRGTLRQVELCPVLSSSRIIPAWAGNTVPTFKAERAWPTTDHPRVGGEHVLVQQSEPRCRIIPAWAGNTLPFGDVENHCAADHPRVGGEHLRMPTCSAMSSRRIIPAWAGNTGETRLKRIGVNGSDHPRVGGEHHITSGVH